MIAIIGSGFGGLGMAIRLKQAGIDDFLIFERASDLGGTWRDNTYPGCACDVESALYSYSFAPNPHWSRVWSPQPEILAYLRGCVARYGLEPHLRFNHALESASWDETHKVWDLRIAGKTVICHVLISAMGALTEPSIPDLPGIKAFNGKIFHSARWDHTHDLAGRKVAVIGTGASAIQFIPEIQPKVGRLLVFQRTPAWVLPHRNRELTEREHRRFESFPLLQRLTRLRIYLIRELGGLAFRHTILMRYLEYIGKRYLRRKIADPVLRAKLTPNYRIGCKRILISSHYYPALQRENVEVVSDAIREVRAGSIVTQDGVERAIDTIILGTGFRLSEMHRSRYITGRGGQTLADSWQGSPRAHLGTSVAGFPNLFFIFGPNTGLGHNSVILMAESQIEHILKAIQWMRKKSIATIEPKVERQTAFNQKVDAKMDSTVWKSGCSSWYLDETGRNSTLWPGSVGSFRRQVACFRPKEYELTS